MKFNELNIIESINKALKEAGYVEPTPIQEKSIPLLLQGKDLLGCAQTGTGKTAAFAVPVLQNIIKSKQEVGNKQGVGKKSRIIRALILAPTRELAIQINENFTMYGKYTGIRNTVIYGGVSQHPQTRILQNGVDILVATPGRLLDLINQKYIDLSNVQHFVLDEADRMFDMGMLHDVKRIVAKLPKVRQNLLFSATMPKEVMTLVNDILMEPVRIDISPVSSTIDIISQGVYFVSKKEKKALLPHILKDESLKSVLVFSRTKHGANNIVKDLGKVGIEALAIHGNKSQNARQLALNNFKEGITRVLVATDIAARGIDVEELSCVINYNLPEISETYVHRIGRTGRAGHSGISISFCDEEEKRLLKDIEKLIGQSIPVLEDEEFQTIRKNILSEPESSEDRRHNSRRFDSRKSSKKTDGAKKPRGNWYGDKSRRGQQSHKSKLTIQTQQGQRSQKSRTK